VDEAKASLVAFVVNMGLYEAKLLPFSAVRGLGEDAIMVDSVSAAQDGWIVIYKDPSNFTSGQVVGYAPVHQGANSNVKVTLNTAKVGDLPTLWAVLQADGGRLGVFEWGQRGRPMSDAPVVENGHNIVTGFGTAASMESAATAPAPAAPAAPVAPTAPVTAKPAATTGPIVIAAQDLNSGVIVASSVTSPVDGWIVVYKDPDNLTSGQIVGYAPVHQGANSNVKVTIDTAKVGNYDVVGSAPGRWRQAGGLRVGAQRSADE
jgi:hypothetical protein